MDGHVANIQCKEGYADGLVPGDKVVLPIREQMDFVRKLKQLVGASLCYVINSDRDDVESEVKTRFLGLEEVPAGYLANPNGYIKKALKNCLLDHNREKNNGGVRGKKKLKRVPMGDDGNPAADPGAKPWPPLEARTDGKHRERRFQLLCAVCSKLAERIKREKGINLRSEGAKLLVAYIYNIRLEGKQISLNRIVKKYCLKRAERDELREFKVNRLAFDRDFLSPAAVDAVTECESNA